MTNRHYHSDTKTTPCCPESNYETGRKSKVDGKYLAMYDNDRKRYYYINPVKLLEKVNDCQDEIINIRKWLYFLMLLFFVYTTTLNIVVFL